MTKRHKLLAANWKMNPAPQGFDMPIGPFRRAPDVDVVVFPSDVDVDKCVAAGLTTGGQAARPQETGAFTGDVSMAMLAAHGCQAVLCGHSERRQHHGETDAQIHEQVTGALAAGLLPFLCVGETDAERSAGNAEAVVRGQLDAALRGITGSVVIAYEPVWAIGTGKSATPADVQAMHAFIRSALPDALRESPLLYGGSVKPENAAEIFACDDVDGALVGGAALKAESFGGILEHLRSSPL
jgi:triosephosphate isomerase